MIVGPACSALATIGPSVFAELEECVDVSRSGQRAFQEMIVKDLRLIEYDVDDLAFLWRPRPGVWINAHVQAGAPCLEGTRVPTAMLASMAEAGDDVENLADDYELTVEVVKAAVAFEDDPAALAA